MLGWTQQTSNKPVKLICTAAKHKVQLHPNKNHAGHLPLHSRNIHKAKLLKHRRPVSHDGSDGWLCPKKAVPTGIWTARRRRRVRRRRRRRRRRTALIKSNNPHLAGGEKTSTSFETNTMSFTNTFEDVSENGVPYYMFFGLIGNYIIIHRGCVFICP